MGKLQAFRKSSFPKPNKLVDRPKKVVMKLRDASYPSKGAPCGQAVPLFTSCSWKGNRQDSMVICLMEQLSAPSN